jgi:hypothetical protein
VSTHSCEMCGPHPAPPPSTPLPLPARHVRTWHAVSAWPKSAHPPFAPAKQEAVPMEAMKAALSPPQPGSRQTLALLAAAVQGMRTVAPP